MSTLLEKLVGAKALIESALEEAVALAKEPNGECKHETVEDVGGAGGKPRKVCVDCGETWEADDAS